MLGRSSLHNRQELPPRLGGAPSMAAARSTNPPPPVQAQGAARCWGLLMDKRRIHLRSASVRTYTFFTTGFPSFLSIRGARGLQVFDLPLHTSYSNPNYD
jgi:hypothetical protein